MAVQVSLLCMADIMPAAVCPLLCACRCVLAAAEGPGSTEVMSSRKVLQTVSTAAGLCGRPPGLKKLYTFILMASQLE